jgi:hypothetical protein
MIIVGFDVGHDMHLLIAQARKWGRICCSMHRYCFEKLSGALCGRGILNRSPIDGVRVAYERGTENLRLFLRHACHPLYARDARHAYASADNGASG